MRSALVVGGAGFIGSHLLRILAESGEYSRLVSADIVAPRVELSGVSYRRADVREPLPDDLSPDAGEIYNLAAIHTTPGHDDWEYYWTNVLGATHTCDYARKVGAKTIVFASSISVYGPSEEPKTEDDRPAPESAYGKSKFCAEAIHRQWFGEQADERKLVIARPAVIYGPGERGNFTRLARLLKKGRFVYPGRKDTIKANGYVEDLVASFRFMLARPERLLLYNFAHPTHHTIEDINRAFCKVAGYASTSAVIPLAPMMLAASGFEVLARLGLRTSINRERIQKLVRSTNIVPQRLTDFAFPFQYTLETSLERWRELSANGDFE